MENIKSGPCEKRIVMAQYRRTYCMSVVSLWLCTARETSMMLSAPSQKTSKDTNDIFQVNADVELTHLRAKK